VVVVVVVMAVTTKLFYPSVFWFSNQSITIMTGTCTGEGKLEGWRCSIGYSVLGRVNYIRLVFSVLKNNIHHIITCTLF